MTSTSHSQPGRWRASWTWSTISAIERLGAARVERARLGQDAAALGDDVDRADAALDPAHVGGGLGVDAPEGHRRDRLRRRRRSRCARPRGGCRRARRAPWKLGLERGRRSARRRRSPRSASRGRRRSRIASAAARCRTPWRPASAVLLADGEQQLDAAPASPRRAARRATSSSTATAALLSAPRIASLAFSQPSSTTTGSIVGLRDQCRGGRTAAPALAAPVAEPGPAVASAGLVVVLADLEAERAQLARPRSRRTPARTRRARDRAQRRERRRSAAALASARAARRRHAVRDARRRSAGAPAFAAPRRRSRGTAARAARAAT